jgi:hypothetical protein
MKKISGYEILPYCVERLYEVVVLMHDLWKGHPDLNVSYFKWKYDDNPYSEKPLGIMALKDGRVVGFRGFFASKWYLDEDNKNIFSVLSPGDTCIHPQHRKVGLSVAMGLKAVDEYSNQYRFFLNTSSTKNSAPGYQKMGYFAIADKSRLMCYNPLLIFLKRFLRLVKIETKNAKTEFKTGDHDDIQVTVNSYPEEMFELVSNNRLKSVKIRLYQDLEFYKWRFNDPRNKHLFFYLKKNAKLCAYLVMVLKDTNRNGIIVDYAFKDKQQLDKLIKLSISKFRFTVFSVFNQGIDAEVAQILIKNGFKSNTFLELRQVKKEGLWPYFVRPIKEDISDIDWMVNGYDVRKIENWELKGICMD